MHLLFRKRNVFLGVFVLVCVLSTSIYMPVLAYYNLGTVTLSLGSTSIEVAKNSQVIVTASMTPAFSDQAKGCGEAKCPQECLEGSCADENGQCLCAGKEYSTYYAGVELTVDNPSIASAKFENGVIKITGRNTGKTTVYAQGALRAYTSSPKQAITVTVISGTSAGGGSGQNTTTASSPSSGTSSGGGKTGTTITSPGQNSSGNDSQTEQGTETSTAAGETSTESVTSETASRFSGSLGTFDTITLGDDTGKTGKSEFESIKGQDITAIFQYKDKADNVIYSWSFNGKDITEPKDIDMGISFSSRYESKIRSLSKLDNVLYLSFKHSGELPGKATIDIKVGDTYKDGDQVMLYYYDENKDTFSLQSKNLTVSDGYVRFDITHCSEYFLSNQMVKEGGNSHIVIWIVIIAAVVIIAGVVIILLRKNKLKREGIFEEEKENEMDE